MTVGSPAALLTFTSCHVILLPNYPNVTEKLIGSLDCLHFTTYRSLRWATRPFDRESTQTKRWLTSVWRQQCQVSNIKWCGWDAKWWGTPGKWWREWHLRLLHVGFHDLSLFPFVAPCTNSLYLECEKKKKQNLVTVKGTDINGDTLNPMACWDANVVKIIKTSVCVMKATTSIINNLTELQKLWGFCLQLIKISRSKCETHMCFPTYQ